MDSSATAEAEARDQLRSLISARVDDTNVYDRDGKKIGTVYTFHIDRWSGQVEYAVLSFGGFLGLGQSYHPIPFGMLGVNQEKGGYTVDADRSLLDGSPSYRPDTAPVWDTAYAKRISDYYGMPPRTGAF
jgi:sporulation protein YlmC with PRC-barrel domain